MIIDNFWVMNYIRAHGNTIVIPKEATIIKPGAFNSQDINENIQLQIEFEEDSQLEIIEPFAFCTEIANTIILPKNIKRIEEFAFFGFPISVQLSDDSSLEVCDNDFVFLGQSDVNVPQNLKRLELSDMIEHLDSITIPANSKLEDLQITNGTDKITLPNGQELSSTSEKSIRVLRLRENKAMILYLNGQDLHYEILDIDTKSHSITGKAFLSQSDMFKSPVLEFDSIFDIDFEMIEDDDYICLKTDFNSQKNFWKNYGTQKGAIYNKAETVLIKSKLEEIISQINPPPEGIKDREKIIYSQIVQQLSRIMQYDFEGAKLIDEQKDIHYISIDEEDEERIDKTQNLKGLLDVNAKSVCKGNSTIINALAQYFGISSKSIWNDTHAWNLVVLDGQTYEDDFTWYLDQLKSGTLPTIQNFLCGNIGGKRMFDTLPHHNIDEPLDLDQGISTTEKINLLSTDWSTIQDWQEVDIRKTNSLDNFVNQLHDFAKNTRITLRNKFSFRHQKKGEDDERNR